MYLKAILVPFIFLLAAFPGKLFAQLDTVKIGVNGLTCSSCSKAVEDKLVRVAFVKSVHMNLNKNEAAVIVDFSQTIDWNVLAKAVYNAGFSVGSFIVPSCGSINNNFNGKECSASYLYIGQPVTLGQEKNYTLIGKLFMDKKTYTEWKKKIDKLALVEKPNVNQYFYY